MISTLAEKIYEKSIQLKKYNVRSLLFKKNRLMLVKEISELQDMTDKLVLELCDNPNYSSDYFDLASFMSKSLSECLVFLSAKGKNNRETVLRYIWGFHNLPRAFLSIKNRMKISPSEALEYYKPYLKLD